MDYDNSATLWKHLGIPRGLGIALKEIIPTKSFHGGNSVTQSYKLKVNKKTRKSGTSSGRHSRKQYTK